MKAYKKILISALGVAFLAMANSCTDNFKDLNTPSNFLTEEKVDVNYILTYVQMQAILGTRVSLANANNHCGMFSSDSNRPFSYAIGSFTTLYITLTNNLSVIIRKTEKDPELVNKKAIARILKVWAFSGGTDVFGDIPYSQSGLAPDKSVSSPVYDTQESMYKDFFKELKEAAAELDITKKSYGTADLIYQGDVLSWKKFANSLRLRLALRVRYADEALAIANMSDLQDSDLIMTTAEDAVAYTATDVAANRNPDYNILANKPSTFRKSFIGKTILDILKSTNDPRIGIYADTAMATFRDDNGNLFGYRGRIINGEIPAEEKFPYTNETVSRQSDFWYIPVIEVPFLRSSEVNFALAEAALFGLKAGDANTYFQQGINEGIAWAQKFYNKAKGQLSPVSKLIHSPSYDYWQKYYPGKEDSLITSYLAFKEIQQPKIDAFILSPAFTLAGTNEEKFEQIMNQKIVALFPMGDEGWAECRRTGYPRVLVGSDNDDLQGVSPRRLIYPAVEATINSLNYKAAVERLVGGDANLSKIWWDKNPLAPHKHPGVAEWRASPY